MEMSSDESSWLLWMVDVDENGTELGAAMS